MKPFENGTAFPARGKIKPDLGGSPVDYSPEMNPVAEGPVIFRRSEWDDSWADKVLPRNGFDALMASFAPIQDITQGAQHLLVAEAVRVLDAARRAPSDEQREKHLAMGEASLSTLATALNDIEGRIDARTVRRNLVRR